MKLSSLIKRFRNRVALMALLAWIYSILELFGALNLLPANAWEIVVIGGVNLLVLLGFVNDPTPNGVGLHPKE